MIWTETEKRNWVDPGHWIDAEEPITREALKREADDKWLAVKHITDMSAPPKLIAAFKRRGSEADIRCMVFAVLGLDFCENLCRGGKPWDITVCVGGCNKRFNPPTDKPDIDICEACELVVNAG